MSAAIWILRYKWAHEDVDVCKVILLLHLHLLHLQRSPSLCQNTYYYEKTEKNDRGTIVSRDQSCLTRLKGYTNPSSSSPQRRRCQRSPSPALAWKPVSLSSWTKSFFMISYLFISFSVSHFHRMRLLCTGRLGRSTTTTMGQRDAPYDNNNNNNIDASEVSKSHVLPQVSQPIRRNKIWVLMGSNKVWKLLHQTIFLRCNTALDLLF